MSDRVFMVIVILIIIAFALLGAYVKLKEAAQKEKKSNKLKAESVALQQPIVTSIEFSGSIRSIDAEDDCLSESVPTELADVSSVIYQDELGQQLKFDLVHELADSNLYQEVTFSVSDMASKTVQMAMPAGQQLYTAASIAQMAPHGLFTATIDPAQLSHFLKDGTYTTMIHGSNGVVAHAGFKQIPGLSGFNPIAIVTIAFQAMAIISGNHYMHLINQKLKSIDDSIQAIKAYNTDHDLGVLSYAQRRLVEITSHPTVTDADMDDIRDIKRDVGKQYDQYRIMYSRQKENVKAYKTGKESVDKRMSGYYAALREFAITAKVCAMSFQIYLQAVLTEISVSIKRDVQKAELDNIINDAVNVCSMCFEDSDEKYRWILTKARKILDERTIRENIIRINEKKRTQLLDPAIKVSIDLSSYMSEAIDTETSESLLYSLRDKKQILLIPGEGNNRPRMYIPANV